MHAMSSAVPSKDVRVMPTNISVFDLDRRMTLHGYSDDPGISCCSKECDWSSSWADTSFLVSIRAGPGGIHKVPCATRDDPASLDDPFKPNGHELAADMRFLADLALHDKFLVLQEYLFFRRFHETSSSQEREIKGRSVSSDSMPA
jgi:hypothetical protein